jgi:hypothetical protein
MERALLLLQPGQVKRMQTQDQFALALLDRFKYLKIM